MDANGLIVGIIGIVAGLLGIIKSIIEIRKQLREDKSLSSLFATRRFRVALGLAILGIALILGVIIWDSYNKDFNLKVQVWDVEMDSKNRIIASNEFKGSTSNGIPESTLEDVAQWLVGVLSLNLTDVKLHVHVPVDWERDKLQIQTTPNTDFKVHYWVIRRSESGVLGKDRYPIITESNEPIDESALPYLGSDFYLEVSLPGYYPFYNRINRSEGLDVNTTLKPVPISIGIEEFQGTSNSIAIWLENYLSDNPRIHVKGPDALKELEAKIEEERKSFYTPPGNGLDVQQMAQVPTEIGLRTILGVDVIISGRYESF